ncbi:MAG: hypothetical protein ABEJ93_04020 [Candidatus Nanohalobium sp.]
MVGIQRELEPKKQHLKPGDVLEPDEAGKIAELNAGDLVVLTINGEEYEVYVDEVTVGNDSYGSIASYTIHGWQTEDREVARGDPTFPDSKEQAYEWSEKDDLSISCQPNIRASWERGKPSDGFEEVTYKERY